MKPLGPWCPHCGDMLPEAAVLTRCPRCGRALPAAATRGVPVRRRLSIETVAAILALLLLGLGGSIYLYSAQSAEHEAASGEDTAGQATAVHALEPPAEGAGAPSAAAAAAAPPTPPASTSRGASDPSADEASVPSRLRVVALTASGRIEEPAIRGAIEQQRPAIEACHRPREALEPGGRSTVPARWVIDRAGKVSHVTLRGSGLTPSGDACLIAALEGLELPAPASGVVTVSASLELVAR